MCQGCHGGARLMTDEYSAYRGLKNTWEGEHSTVCHGTKEYARGDVHVNTAESSHALLKRGIVGIYHNVSCEYLHRYLWQYDFLWNTRKMNDGERTVLAIRESGTAFFDSSIISQLVEALSLPWSVPTSSDVPDWLPPPRRLV